MYLFLDGKWGPRLRILYVDKEGDGPRPNLQEEYLQEDWVIFEERAEKLLRKLIEGASIPNKDEAIWLGHERMLKVLREELN